jgi:hypothetical protein
MSSLLFNPPSGKHSHLFSRLLKREVKHFARQLAEMSSVRYICCFFPITSRTTLPATVKDSQYKKAKTTERFHSWSSYYDAGPEQP